MSLIELRHLRYCGVKTIDGMNEKTVINKEFINVLINMIGWNTIVGGHFPNLTLKTIWPAYIYFAVY